MECIALLRQALDECSSLFAIAPRAHPPIVQPQVARSLLLEDFMDDFNQRFHSVAHQLGFSGAKSSPSNPRNRGHYRIRHVASGVLGAEFDASTDEVLDFILAHRQALA